MDTTSFDQVIALLPPKLRQSAQGLSFKHRHQAEELRLRISRPLTVLLPEGEVPLGEGVVTEGDLRLVLDIATQASIHTVLGQLRQGFLTVKEGHRVGLCGTGVMEGVDLRHIHPVSSLSIRIAREITGTGTEILPQLWGDTAVKSTLIVAPPGAGKTTLLRDLVRGLSEGEHGRPQRVGLCDQRGELAAMWGGCPQFNVGRHTDVVDGVPKDMALMMLLRGMNPQVIAMDEITHPQDVAALEMAAGCGVSLLATAHGSGLDAMRRRPIYRDLLASGIFSTAITVTNVAGKRGYTVTDIQAVSHA